MASGRPLLAAVGTKTATHALVTASESGLVAPPENPAALAATVRRLYREPALRHCYGENGRRYVTSHHRPQTVARQYADCLQKVAAGGKLELFHDEGG
jgi:glycosyltransferase involved in cell wall biosynthesis